MNDSDREQWVSNDEGLYNWYSCSGQSLRQFVRENREALTQIINRALGR